MFPLLAQEKIKISHLPYLQALTDSSVSIIWTSNNPAIAWVEIAPNDSTHFYKQEREKLFAQQYGFKMVGTVHQVNISGLKPGTTYRYRVYNQEVLKHEGTRVQYGDFAATNVYREQPLKFKTPGPSAEVSFAVVNDIHGKNEVLRNLIKQVDIPKTDFVVFNGDMVDNLLSENQMYGGFMDTAIALFASEKPMYYARGNHETRGSFATAYPKYFPTSSGELYYLFNYGEACILVLDCGEDKPDSDIEYSGIVDMDAYRSQQAKWLEKAVESPLFKNAKYKIVICHMPPFGGWHGSQDIRDKFVPILNKAGAQIMLSGHLHRHIIQKQDQQVHFPVLVNSNVNLIKVQLNDQEGSFKVYSQEGKLVDEIKIKPLN
ncbi:metallophosphoesterase [Sphingobacterium sp. HJSM2_6]|uniref:metallophosphoesterase n=1 Tax=Sphingobacterium sp. HJSM2_6 TaxID=3366264 RepID=UPI003BD8394F